MALPIDRMVLFELQLVGSHGMPATRYPSMLQMVEAKKLRPREMITETVGLDGASRVLEQMTTFQNVGVSIINQYWASALRTCPFSTQEEGRQNVLNFPLPC